MAELGSGQPTGAEPNPFCGSAAQTSMTRPPNTRSRLLLYTACGISVPSRPGVARATVSRSIDVLPRILSVSLGTMLSPNVASSRMHLHGAPVL